MSASLPISESKEDENLSTVELQLVEAPLLTDAQRTIVQTLYEEAKMLTTSLLSDKGLDSSIKITQVIAQLMVLAEKVQVEGQKITGKDKKAAVLEVGRLLLKDLVKDDIERVKLRLMYDVLADKTLEAMIQMSHVVNQRVIQEVGGRMASSCWDCLASLCGAKPLTEEEKNRKLASQCI